MHHNACFFVFCYFYVSLAFSYLILSKSGRYQLKLFKIICHHEKLLWELFQCHKTVGGESGSKHSAEGSEDQLRQSPLVSSRETSAYEIYMYVLHGEMSHFSKDMLSLLFIL